MIAANMAFDRFFFGGGEADHKLGEWPAGPVATFSGENYRVRLKMTQHLTPETFCAKFCRLFSRFVSITVLFLFVLKQHIKELNNAT